MVDKNNLLAVFSEYSEAEAAHKQLQARRLASSTLVYKSKRGEILVKPVRGLKSVLYGMVGGLIGFLLGFSICVSLNSFDQFICWIGIVSLSAVGFVVALFLAQRNKIQLHHVSLNEIGSWLIAEEVFLVVQTTPRKLGASLSVLRREADSQPAIFSIDFEHLEVDEPEVIRSFPLTSQQLGDHAEYLADEYRPVDLRYKGEPVLDQLDRTEVELQQIHRQLHTATIIDESISPAAEWLLDNAYIVEGHITDVKENLPRRFYHELPEIMSREYVADSNGFNAHRLRVYDLARELTLHTDAQISKDNLTDFLQAYQTISSLRIGELWAFPLFLRIAIIERIRVLGEQVVWRLHEGELADFWANRLVAATRRDSNQLFTVLADLAKLHPQPSAHFAAQLTSHLYDEESALVPVQSWLERQLRSSLPDLISREQEREAATQVSIGNAITSLRELSLFDWRDVFERISVVEQILRRDPARIYQRMDFDTRNRYRSAVEEISKGGSTDEEVVAQQAIGLAEDHYQAQSDDPRIGHVGYYLIDEGRPQLAGLVSASETSRRKILQWIRSHHTSIYIGAITLVTIILDLPFIFIGRSLEFISALTILILLAAILPCSQLAVQLVNYLFTRILPPSSLPKLDFELDDIPDEFRTLVVVPFLLVNQQTLDEEIKKLEVRYLANPNTNLVFSLYGDFADSSLLEAAEDEQLSEAAVVAITRLNHTYGDGRFYFFLREREWCETELAYIGWERKRGKLEELNALICGEESRRGPAMVKVGDPQRLQEIRFVITLDSDTQLPRESARRLIETLAHPLNLPHQTNNGQKTSKSGYTIIQPRVSTSLPSAIKTRFSRLFTDPVGTDPYTKAVSDVYQDLSGEGSYVGKGIYDPRSFSRILQGKFKEQALLSHDLIEGAYVRTGLASDLELFDDFPLDYITYTRRQHRWIRGDWQIAEWCTPLVQEPKGGWTKNPLSWLNRWKIFDNLRRSLVPAASVFLLLLTWLASPSMSLLATIIIAVVLLFQTTAQLATGATTTHGLRNLSWFQLLHSINRSLTEASLLPHQAGLSIDAITRVLYRRLVSHKKLLEWTTAQMAGWQKSGQRRSFALHMSSISLFSLVLAVLVWRIQPASLPYASIFLVLWFASPLIGFWLNTEGSGRDPKQKISSGERDWLRSISRKTWRYFDDFVTAETSWLPPDNYQVSHKNQLALRTSPTNVGLWILSLFTAHDFGYQTIDQVTEKLSNTFQTLEGLERVRGHLLNWYDIRTLTPLNPRYVSTVDSGNLLASIWAATSALDELFDEVPFQLNIIHGLKDSINVLLESMQASEIEIELPQQLQKITQIDPAQNPKIIGLYQDLRGGLGQAINLTTRLRDTAIVENEAAYWARRLEGQLSAAISMINRYYYWLVIIAESNAIESPAFSSFRRHCLELSCEDLPSLSDLAGNGTSNHPLLQQFVESLSNKNGTEMDEAREAFARSQWFAGESLSQLNNLKQVMGRFAGEMDMRFLYDPDHHLFSIGFNVDAGQLDGSYYDLLASEARLASFVAIARGEIPSEHWLSMNRPFGNAGGRNVLLSWSGTMFEYLMPLLLQRAYSNSLLNEAVNQAVSVQVAYGRKRGVPWGISESAYGDLDANKTYQYKAFGVPELGLKRGLEEDLVVAPYATMLAIQNDPSAATKNLKRLASMGMLDNYGFYEAVDFSRQRRREGERGILVRTYMAHHQGMSFIALSNYTHENIMQARFHADPRVVASEPLLYERIPVSPPLYHVPTREQPPSRVVSEGISPSVSKFDTPHTETPKTQLLSNGSYSLMLTGAGGGYSRWGGFELTRWRSDTTMDSWGSFVFIRDVDRGSTWSTTFQPTRVESQNYQVRFAIDRAEIKRTDHGIETESIAIVSSEDDVELRQVTVINRSMRKRRLQLTSYYELSMSPHVADRQHPAFNKLFIQTEALSAQGVLLASRRSREAEEGEIHVGHRITSRLPGSDTFEFETDRKQFLGRSRDLSNPLGIGDHLSGMAGYVLDPCFSLRQEIELDPGEKRSFTFVLGAAGSREDVLKLMEKYSQPVAVERALELAWARAQLELRQLRIQPDDARRFQKLASFVLYPSASLRPPSERLVQNKLGQSSLWPYGISGDLPIVVVSIGEARDLNVVRQLLQAHTYWRQHGLKVDLVILNEESTSYQQPLHEELVRLIQGYSMYTGVDQPGGIFLRNVDQMPAVDVSLIVAVARISLVAARGPLLQQLNIRFDSPDFPERPPAKEIEEEPSAMLPFMELPYFNGLGGFSLDGHEYVIYLGPGDSTPAPWVNVIANPNFGTLISESGVGFTWYGNSQRNRLTPWGNDPVTDTPSEAIYIRDEDTGTYWSPTPLPVRELDAYRTRHGAGYSTTEHNSHAINQELTTFVPLDEGGGEPLRIQRLRLHNDSSRTRRLSVTFAAELVLGEHREDSQMHILTNWSQDLKTLFATNPYNEEYGDRVTFVTTHPSPVSYSGDRGSFLGRNKSFTSPLAMKLLSLSETVGAGLDPCAAVQTRVDLPPGQTAEITILLGQASSISEAEWYIQKYRESLAVDKSLELTRSWWDRRLGVIQVEVPELSAQFMVNRWLLYQTLSCRIWARSAFYQSGGAYGYRDQLQDVLSLLYIAPEMAREHILRSAGRQFREGDVQHWWHPPSGIGVRTKISDDFLWLPYTVSEYVRVTGDTAILDEQAPFLEGPTLEGDEQELFVHPVETVETDSVFEHCRRAVERGLTAGPHGLPLIGAGDWNDGLNKVGIEGKGESVWLAWFLIEVLNRFSELADFQGKPDLSTQFKSAAARLADTVEWQAWDGSWYRRAYFDDGSVLGSQENEEAFIDSLPQSWSQISNAAKPERIEQALDSAWKNLVQEDRRLVLLFTPPFEASAFEPGYIKAYPPGVRENGGQYTHAAIWLAIAYARQGNAERAAQLLQILNPIERTHGPEDVQSYIVEPYVIPADIYSLSGKSGMGGWTWYTGSSSWLYRAWVEEVLGLKIRNRSLSLEPIIPASWKTYKIQFRYGEAVYEITVENPEGVSSGVFKVEMDGQEIDGGIIPLEEIPIKHKVLVQLGKVEGDSQ